MLAMETKHTILILCAAVCAYAASAADAYIESTGTQALNSGYRVNPDSRIEVDFQMSEVSNQARIFGADSSPTEFSALYVGNDGTAFNYG